MTRALQHSGATVEDPQVRLLVSEAQKLRAELLGAADVVALNAAYDEVQRTLRGLAVFLGLRIARVSPPEYDLDALREGMTEVVEEEAA